MKITKILTLACLGFASLSAMQFENTLEQIDTVIKQPVSQNFTMPSRCILDFSSNNAIVSSTAKICAYLMSENINGGITLLDLTYITFEGIAAGSRQNPIGYGKMASYFQDPNAVYDSFTKIAKDLTIVQKDLSSLSNSASCSQFVNNAVSQELPILLNYMGAPKDAQDNIKLLSNVFTPMFSALLNKTYCGIVIAANNLQEIEEEIEEKMSSWCSCLPCFRGKKTQQKK